MQADGIIDAN